MPHLHMEYTANLPELNADMALIRLNNALVASGQFAAEFDIKSRAVKVETFKIGTAMGERAFVHVKLALLSGRSPQIKKQLSESLLTVVQELCEWPTGVEVQLCVEILDIDRESYTKTAIGH
ncbi:MULTISPECIES: 5-carboxymethyl-2-hydroxymuconate Delta-isomerase [unclassified Pseudomonas]|jgi:5-carboxymethyl-2-hydroxymuconate isomerase|uniref:5-carboxymethyl-2-hydroxymuconate Delta-isomerase n=1 Tax=unclassified Pseudomonas TaxID=196821 RepID=UPI0011A28D42|nr:MULTISPECIES: 5-carboxymethyl-2-hydroxymuconate Delta-isomerase [unclassified Pseudomonas]MBA4361212.1 5-carboxymethyl-2-hydroxymuconate isomerase [Pseudomonas sp.]QQO00344.1 5-carboxymethyl-2-hydroxymuconate Delta-isomerase [Pseudomonas sp. SW-3]TWC22461.1 5-carboxymethyl-2-hydroxymuconate isomerase [Pseudomonas sp. SJZ083]TWC48553.1 5-carboxymethyl-2-hydroxymuconate isomerase [Pseudomonas sp. SJZ077]WNF57096.1 5-carboxymethyl-2-hydroxymuconate Delta-isomerase [Pseudomonas sp. SG20052]